MSITLNKVNFSIWMNASTLTVSVNLRRILYLIWDSYDAFSIKINYMLATSYSTSSGYMLQISGLPWFSNTYDSYLGYSPSSRLIKIGDVGYTSFSKETGALLFYKPQTNFISNITFTFVSMATNLPLTGANYDMTFTISGLDEYRKPDKIIKSINEKRNIIPCSQFILNTNLGTALDPNNLNRMWSFSLNLAQIIGNDIFDTYEKYILRIKSISFDLVNGYPNTRVVLRISGLPCINFPFTTVTGTNSTYLSLNNTFPYQLSYVKLPTNESTSFQELYGELIITNKSPLVNIVLSYCEIFSLNFATPNGVNPFPHSILTFEIIPTHNL
jgi:hypothetical protein